MKEVEIHPKSPPMSVLLRFAALESCTAEAVGVQADFRLLFVSVAYSRLQLPPRRLLVRLGHSRCDGVRARPSFRLFTRVEAREEQSEENETAFRDVTATRVQKVHVEAKTTS